MAKQTKGKQAKELGMKDLPRLASKSAGKYPRVDVPQSTSLV